MQDGVVNVFFIESTFYFIKLKSFFQALTTRTSSYVFIEISADIRRFYVYIYFQSCNVIVRPRVVLKVSDIGESD